MTTTRATCNSSKSRRKDIDLRGDKAASSIVATRLKEEGHDPLSLMIGKIHAFNSRRPRQSDNDAKHLELLRRLLPHSWSKRASACWWRIFASGPRRC